MLQLRQQILSGMLRKRNFLCSLRDTGPGEYCLRQLAAHSHSLALLLLHTFCMLAAMANIHKAQKQATRVPQTQLNAAMSNQMLGGGVSRGPISCQHNRLIQRGDQVKTITGKLSTANTNN